MEETTEGALRLCEGRHWIYRSMFHQRRDILHALIASASTGTGMPKTLRDWLLEGPFTLSLASSFFGFFAHCGVLQARME